MPQVHPSATAYQQQERRHNLPLLKTWMSQQLSQKMAAFLLGNPCCTRLEQAPMA